MRSMHVALVEMQYNVVIIIYLKNMMSKWMYVESILKFNALYYVIWLKSLSLLVTILAKKCSIY